jgi:hypothetical protein
VPGIMVAAAPSPWLRSSLRSFLRHGSGAPRPLAHELAGFVAVAPLRPVRPGIGMGAARGTKGDLMATG